MPRQMYETYEESAIQERRQRAATHIQSVARRRAARQLAARLRAEKAEDEWLEAMRSELKDTIHADLIPPKDKAGNRDWESRKARVRRVLFIHFMQLVLTWVLFAVSISHYSLARKNSKECTAVLMNQGGESSIAATCTGAVLVNESRIEVRDPFYEAALNLTERFPDGDLPDELQDKLSSDSSRNARGTEMIILVFVMELFLVVHLAKKYSIA